MIPNLLAQNDSCAPNFTNTRNFSCSTFVSTCDLLCEGNVTKLIPWFWMGATESPWYRGAIQRGNGLRRIRLVTCPVLYSRHSSRSRKLPQNGVGLLIKPVETQVGKGEEERERNGFFLRRFSGSVSKLLVK